MRIETWLKPAKSWLKRLNAISGVKILDKSLDKRPNIPLAVLGQPSALEQFFSAFEFYMEELKKAGGGAAQPG